MKRISARTLSLVGFAASQWASERLNGSRRRKQYRQLITAGLVLHEQPELYAAAPKMRRALATIARHAAPLAAVVLLAGCSTLQPEVQRPDTRIVNIRIASLPPQSCVFMNGEFMGLTPLVMPVEADSEGKWKTGVRIQCQVPQDPFNQDTYKSPAGFAVPKHLLFRVPKYTMWHTATQQYPLAMR